MTEQPATWLLVKAGWRRTSTYRLALLAGLMTNSVFGFVRVSIMTAAITSAGTAIAGYDAVGASSFVWWSQAFIAALGLFGWNDIAVRIKSGDIAVDFARPIHPFTAYLAADVGRTAVSLLTRGVPSLVIGGLTFGIAPPQSLAVAGLGFVAIWLGLLISFCGRYLVNMAALWIVEVRGLLILYMVLSGLFAGLFMPVPWFPEWLRTIMYATPFPSILQTPVDILSGKLGLVDSLRGVGIQIAWATVMTAAALVVTSAGRRHLEVQGG